MERILIIQTAFIGDVILATGVIEKFHKEYPAAKIDFLLRKGNEGLFEEHPFISELIIWDKKKKKFQNLFEIIKKIRNKKYNLLINIHRFATSGIITAFSKAEYKVGFDKNPLSFTFSKKIQHKIDTNKGQLHEVNRNDSLIKDFTSSAPPYIRLYPASKHLKKVENYQNKDYICIAPTSVWYTKQYPQNKWVELIDEFSENIEVYLLGAPNDFQACEIIRENTKKRSVTNLCGKLNFLESAALMSKAKMNYVNDSAPLHIASAVNAPVTAIFCSTIPAFGFGPLSENSKIVETQENLSCRPCGLHGYKECPKKHFKCAFTIKTEQLLE